MDIRTELGRRILFCDGAMGTMLQAAGLPEGRLPDVWGGENPQAVQAIHRAYLEAGCRLITTNTFGTTAPKVEPYGYTVAQVMSAAVANVRAAMDQAGVTDAYVCADIGPTGKLLRPYGDLDFEEAVARFAAPIRAAEEAGADCILIETMSDLYEMKAAVVAAKENCSLPILASLIFDGSGKLLTGGSPQAAVALLEGLGVDVIGLNCGLGPQEMAPVFRQLWEAASVPLLLQPNAGLPRSEGGKTVYDVTPADYAAQMAELAPMATLLGGCCGTTPAHLSALIQATKDLPLPEVTWKDTLLISSYCQAVALDGRDPVVIGERINPTGKKRFKEALLREDMDYILDQALQQTGAGADLLDVNVGLPEIDEPAMMVRTVKALQGVTDAPLQLDSSDRQALEAGLRAYNGKPIVNSVNGDDQVLDALLPLVKKYGAAVVGLTLDRNGIPKTAEERLAVARHILDKALAYGIRREDVYIDCLTLTVSAEPQAAAETLKAVALVKEELGLKTVLGVSNISFGLPGRPLINQNFLTMAMTHGLDLPILNPNVEAMTAAVRCYHLLTNQDADAKAFIAAYGGTPAAPSPAPAAGRSLADTVIHGLKGEAHAAARALLETTAPMEVVNGVLIPALDKVGADFEAGRIFLPQLIQAAGAAQAAFEVVRERLSSDSGGETASRGTIVLATVQGDIHDIGKNIVKVLLENYGYTVVDLGRDVDPAAVAEAVRRHEAPLVGLSALMTTTLGSMAKTITLLHEEGLSCRVMVGGAVLTPDYARKMGADFYSGDAKESVDIAKRIFG